MDSVKCEALLTAAEQGSLTRAGEILGYTQSGITRMIRSLEQETGFPMLIRTQHGVRLTADGKAMLPALRNIVKAQQIAAEQGAAIRGVIQGSLNIGSYYSVRRPGCRKSCGYIGKSIRRWRFTCGKARIWIFRPGSMKVRLTAACLPGRRKESSTTGSRWPGMSFLSGYHRRMMPQASRIFRFLD